jgi:hypothetical protein
MKRYHEEKHIIESRVKKNRQLNISWQEFGSWRDQSSFQVDAGKYRKTLRCSGCTRARCQVCHPEKYPKRKPTRQELQAKKELNRYDQDR